MISNVKEVHFNKALLSFGDRGALCHKEKMSKSLIKEDNGVINLVEEDFRRIRSHVMNETEEKKEEKYKQLEFDFDDDFNLTDELVAPI